MPNPQIQNALISVSDKTGLTEFARGLVAAGITIYASGGTRRHLETAGIPVQEVAAYTGFPEMMDGRIKTLHPKIHGGILGRTDHREDLDAMATHGVVPFGLVVVNLYPFETTISQPDVSPADAIEQIDIGGPTLVRGAAKNHAYVAIASSPSQYPAIRKEIELNGGVSDTLRRELAGAAFAHTAAYDTAIANYFVRPATNNDDKPLTDCFERRINLTATHEVTLRYGENPHQSAALYASSNADPNSLVRAEQLNGKELSYNNLLDLDAALSAASSLPTPSVVVLKHNNPCGAATAPTLGAATQKAWDGDPASAFGSILGFNVPVDLAAAECLAEPGKFVEAIIAPDFEPAALEILTTKPKWRSNVRLLRVGKVTPGTGALQIRSISGGYLLQQTDNHADEVSAWHQPTEQHATEEQLANLKFAWSICRHVKSNAIVFVKDCSLVGVGAGQMSRVDAVEIAIRKAGDRSSGAVLASDAFFPFDDSIHNAAQAGIVAVIQPGGSRRDEEVIAACNEHDLPMLLTGRRHFRH